MNEARTLLDYQREVSQISEISARPAPLEGERERERWGMHAATLYRADWSYVVRGGVRIWCKDPDDWRYRWKSEEVAYGIVTRSDQKES